MTYKLMKTLAVMLFVFSTLACSNSSDILDDKSKGDIPNQNGSNEDGFSEPVMIAILNGTASSEETVNDKTGFQNSFDGDVSTFWHSKWSDQGKLPFEAIYNFEKASKLTYINYVPRLVGTNGNFGEIEIHVATKTNPNFTKVMDYDCGKSGQISTIVLPKAVEDVTSVKFLIKTSVGSHASCSEMEFYSSDPVTHNYKSIALGGNTYLTVKGSGNDLVTDGGLQNWSSPNAVFSTYFKTTKEGSLELALKSTSNTDGNIIRVSYLDKSFDVTLPKGSNRIIKIGTLENVKPGYVKIDFQGVELKDKVYASPSELLVAGTAVTEDMHYVKDFSYHFGRRGPSVHLRYTLPQGDTEYFYNEVTVPVGEDVIGSYYMANGFGQGYFGMQVNSETERRVLFSVWSPYETDNPNDIPVEDRIAKVRQGKDVHIGEFGNEGSGGQSYMRYPWVAGNTYKFLLQVKPDGNGSTVYTAYFFAPEEGEWRLLASFKRPKTTTWYTNAYSFLENFNPNQGYITRKVHFGNQWALSKDGVWTELLIVGFTYDATAKAGVRTDYKGGFVEKENKFYLQNCGFFNESTQTGTTYTRKANQKHPEIDFEALSKIPSI